MSGRCACLNQFSLLPHSVETRTLIQRHTYEVSLGLYVRLSPVQAVAIVGVLSSQDDQ